MWAADRLKRYGRVKFFLDQSIGFGETNTTWVPQLWSVSGRGKLF